MRIAFVYDLRDDHLAAGLSEEEVAEFDTRETVDEVAGGIARLGHAVDCVGAGRQLAARLVAGERWDLVFSIAEGRRGRAREAQVPALCELFDQPYAFSDPLTMASCLDKAVAKRLVAIEGIATAPFAVLRRADEAGAVDLPFPLFVKPIAEGTGKGCEAASRVTNSAELADAAGRLIARFDQPVIAETFLAGREFTVGIVGTAESARAIGVAEVIVHDGTAGGVYSLQSKEECESRVTYRLATDVDAARTAKAALAAYRALDCRDGARLDFRCDGAGVPNFLEANPIAGLHPTHSDLPIVTSLAGHDYEWLLNEIIESAGARLGIGSDKRSARKPMPAAA